MTPVDSQRPIREIEFKSGEPDPTVFTRSLPSRRMADPPPSPPLDQALPRELLVLTIAHHMHEGSDVKRLSLTSRFFFSLVRSTELVAAWLWQRRGNEAILMAMRKRDMAVLRQLVDVQRADVNVLGDDGYALLHEASSEGRLEYVTYLLSVPGIQVNLRTR